VDTIYNEQYYSNYSLGDHQTNYPESVELKGFFNAVSTKLKDLLNPSAVLDAGCACGLLVAAFQENGVVADGVDISEYAISKAGPTCKLGSLTDLGEFGLYDLVTCIEVLEHMPEEEALEAIRQFSLIARTVVFSSTSGPDDDPTHINLHPQEYWVEKFEEVGFRLSDKDVSFICPWAKCFERG
jgi:2-polyprenyl-3-methyl-5-hydroxy-6-metoxy-1,4-benzoquinol methylase